MRAWAALLLLGLVLAGCSSPPPPSPPGPPPPTPVPTAGFNPIVKFSTDSGDFYVEVFEEQAPVTAANFLGYARSHFYDGQRVHRVVPDFVVQMGDPNTRDLTKPRESWGQGDPNLRPIPDEFHPALRHDKAGMVSMATAGADTGTSQFFVTLGALPRLDDKHSVFGRVVAGLEVVQAMGKVPTTSRGPVQNIPVTDIVIRSTQVLEKDRKEADVRHALGGWSYRSVVNTTSAYIMQFGVVVENRGTVREVVQGGLDLPEGWTWAPVCPRDARTSDCPIDRNVSAGAPKMYLFQLGTPENATFGDVPVRAWFNASGVNASVPLTVHVGSLGRLPTVGENVSVHYIGTLPDGRLFDSSLWHVVSNESIPKVANVFIKNTMDQYHSLDFELGTPELVQGFNDITSHVRVGETAVVAIPPERAYGPAVPGNKAALAGRWLYFGVELLSVAS